MNAGQDQGRSHAARVQSMFDRIAQRYDLLNRWMTFGQDRVWRQEAVEKLAPRTGDHILDLGAGSGDLVLEILRQCPGARVTAADFSAGMIAVGRQRTNSAGVCWVRADALRLPFEAARFDAVVCGFLLRNVSDLDQGLRELARILKPGARLVCLDTTPPRTGLLQPLLDLHLRLIIPSLGRLLAGDVRAYRYLPESTRQFLDAESLASRMRAAGFTQVGFRRRMLGAIALHWGLKHG